MLKTQKRLHCSNFIKINIAGQINLLKLKITIEMYINKQDAIRKYYSEKIKVF